MNCYIYARVSSVNDRQSTERQIKSLSDYAASKGYSIVKIYQEHISGAARNKKVLTECLEDAKTNGIDLILFNEVSRCGRAIWEVLSSVKFCIDNRINVYFQKENLLLFQEGEVSKVFAIYLSCLSMCAEIERENIYYRLRQGRELAIAKGTKMGRKIGSKESVERRAEKHANVIRCLKKGCSVRDTAKLCGVSVSTTMRVKNEFKL